MICNTSSLCFREIYLWTNIFHNEFPLDGETHFFICEENWILEKKKLELQLIFILFYFLKGKQNKKEKP